MSRPRSNRQRKPRPSLPQDVATEAEMRGMTPLQCMLAVMRNPKTSARRRDRMAVTAARYLHPRPGDVGKKQLADEAARLADGEWFEDLEYSDGPRRQ